MIATRKGVTKARVGAQRSRTAIRDIAALAGVSVATVSRVLNGRPDVSPATRATVLHHIHERGYVSNRSARALAGGRTGLIGLTVSLCRRGPRPSLQGVTGTEEHDGGLGEQRR